MRRLICEDNGWRIVFEQASPSAMPWVYVDEANPEVLHADRFPPTWGDESMWCGHLPALANLIGTLVDALGDWALGEPFGMDD